jgi:hypothetical protein
MLSKEQFLSEVWTKINELSCDPVDAVIETADFNKLDMETAAKIVSRDPLLKSAIEQYARALNHLKAAPSV